MTVIAVSAMASLQELGFGQEMTLRWIPVHEVISLIGPQKCQGAHIFHALTGCDVVSAFRGRGESHRGTFGTSVQKTVCYLRQIQLATC